MTADAHLFLNARVTIVLVLFQPIVSAALPQVPEETGGENLERDMEEEQAVEIFGSLIHGQ